MTILFFFLYIFAFPIANISFIDSSWIALFLLIVYFFFNSEYRKTCIQMFSDKILYRVAIAIVVISCYCAIITTLLCSYDYHFIVTLVHQLISAFIGVFVVSFAVYKKKNIVETIIYVFCIQSIIQVVSMASPQFREVTNVFRPASAIIRGQWTYTGIRGLAISGSAFFGLSIVYGLVFIIWALNSDKIMTKVPALFKCIICILLIFGGISAGRTSAFGLLFAAIIMIYKKRLFSTSISKRNLIISSLGLLVIVPLIVFFKQRGLFDLKVFEYFNNYATEFFRTGSTTSGDSLRHMYFKLDLDTLILGDGYYGSSTHYYMSTDAGYMRVILYIGIPGLLLLTWLQNIYLKSKDKLIIMLFIFTMQIKGEVLGFSILFEAVLLLYYYYQSTPADFYSNDNNMQNQSNDIVYNEA